MPFTPGLVSVTFRQLTPAQVIALAIETGLTAMEWGGDVHVPPDDLARAGDVGRMTREAGLSVIAYGSYFRVGEDDPAGFDAILDTAAALQAPAIRVWAGRRGSAAADERYRGRVIDEMLQIADRAKPAGVVLCYEFHADTLTDTDPSAQELLRATEHAAIGTLWQPPHEQTVDERCDSLRSILAWLHHIHVFHWPRRGERAPLEEGSGDWNTYLNLLREEGKDCPLLLEFVRGDDPEQLRRDARTLLEWISESQ